MHMAGSAFARAAADRFHGEFMLTDDLHDTSARDSIKTIGSAFVVGDFDDTHHGLPRVPSRLFRTRA